MPTFEGPETKLLKTLEIVGNPGNQHFLLFPKSSLSYQRQFLAFKPLLTLSQMTNFRLFQNKRVCRRRVTFNENGG